MAVRAPVTYTDATGRTWTVIDWYRPNLDGPRKRLPLGSGKAEGRAFVPEDREGPPLVLEFGRVAYRDTADRTLAAQLAAAKPANANAAERMDRA